MARRNPFNYFRTSPEIIRLAVMMYVRFPLSLRNLEEILHEPGVEVGHETIRFWLNKLGPIFAAGISKGRLGVHQSNWDLDEVFVKINGETHYQWHVLDHED